MNQSAQPPIYADQPISGIEDLAEGPWTLLVMSLLACVAVVLFAAAFYSGGV